MRYFKSLLIAILMWAIFLAPGSPSITPSVAQPYIGPIWFGIYCNYPGTIPPQTGYVRATWIDNFPEGWEIDPSNPGIVTIFYPPSTYQRYEWYIVDNDVSHTVAALWRPTENATAEISGYMRIHKPDGSASGMFSVTPLNIRWLCPEPNHYLPAIFKRSH